MTIESSIQKVLSKYGGLINQWRGQIPAGIVAARIVHEGMMNARCRCTSDSQCGGGSFCYNGECATRCGKSDINDPKMCKEVGLLQVWRDTTGKRYAMTDGCDPNDNIRVGCAHWNAETDKFRNWIDQNGFAQPSGFDFWATAYLYTAIGGPGTQKLIRKAGDAAYSSIAAWTAQAAIDGTVPQLGSQSPAIVARRVKNAGKYVTTAFNAEGTASPSGDSSGVLLIVAAALGLIYWYKRKH